MTRPDILVFIMNFIKGFNREELIKVFTSGNCYHFSIILKNIYPEGRIIYSQILGHFLFEYNQKYYDITGEVENIPDIIYFDTLFYEDFCLYNTLMRDCVLKIDYGGIYV